MAVKPLWTSPPQYVDSSGNPYSSARLFFYAAGSSTKQNIYTDDTGNTAAANPNTLNSSGYPVTSGNVFVPFGTVGQTYKIVLAPPGSDDPPNSSIWTADDIAPINDTVVSVDQWVVGPTPTYISSTSFSLVGDQTSTFTVGRRIKTTNSGGTVYSTIISSVFGAITTIVVRNDGSSSLDSGLSAVSYGLISAADTSEPALGGVGVCNGRLTLTTAVPVTTADVTGAETVFFTPFRGNKIDLYDSTVGWVRFTFTELSLDVPDAAQVNDVFIFNNAGTLTLEAVAWSNDTTRATGLVLQDGVLVKSGAVTRRYLGSFYSVTTGNGQTEDSFAKRHLWNYYNRVRRPMRVVEATNTWEYTTAAFRQANSSSANQLDFITGVSEDAVMADVLGSATNSSAEISIRVGIGLDSTTVNSATRVSGSVTSGANTVGSATASYEGFPGIGKHLLVWLEFSTATGTTTWWGDNGAGVVVQTGIVGSIMG